MVTDAGDSAHRPLGWASFVAAAAAVAACAVYESSGYGDPQGGPAAPLDDAYIYCQYATRAAHGHWLQYNDVSGVSVGFTSWAHFLLLTGASWIGVPDTRLLATAFLLGAAFHALSAALAAAIAVRTFGSVGGWLAGLLVAWNGPLLWASVSGLETSMAVAAMLAMALSAIDAAPRRFVVAAAAWLSLARAEGALLVLAACTFFPRGRKGGAALGAMAGLATAILTFLWTGHFTPTSAAPKSPWWNPALDPASVAFQILRHAVLEAGPVLLGIPHNDPLDPLARHLVFLPPLTLALAFVGFLSKVGSPTARATGALAAAGIGVACVALPVPWHHQRYLSPAYGLLLALLPGGLLALFRARATLVIAAGLCFVATLVGAGQFARLYRNNTGDIAGNHLAMAAQLASGAWDGRRVAAVDAGALQFRTSVQLVDIRGIVDRRFLPCAQRSSAYLVGVFARLPPADRPSLFVLQPERPDFRVEMWVRAELLRPLPVSTLSSVRNVHMGLYEADWSSLPDLGTEGRDVLQECDLESEAQHSWRGAKGEAGLIFRKSVCGARGPAQLFIGRPFTPTGERFRPLGESNGPVRLTIWARSRGAGVVRAGWRGSAEMGESVSALAPGEDCIREIDVPLSAPPGIHDELSIHFVPADENPFPFVPCRYEISRR